MKSKLFHSPLTTDELSEIVRLLRQGEVGLFPTDTVYGLGCRANSANSTTSIFLLKERPLDKALPLLIGGWGMFDQLCGKISRRYRNRLETVWPGALTVVVPGSRESYSLSYHCQREGTVAMRMPNHPSLRFIIEQLGIPLASTSANITGHMEALSLEMVCQSIRSQVGWAWSEPIPHNEPLPSTVVDLTGKTPVILRQGAIEF